MLAFISDMYLTCIYLSPPLSLLSVSPAGLPLYLFTVCTVYICVLDGEMYPYVITYCMYTYYHNRDFVHLQWIRFSIFLSNGKQFESWLQFKFTVKITPKLPCKTTYSFSFTGKIAARIVLLIYCNNKCGTVCPWLTSLSSYHGVLMENKTVPNSIVTHWPKATGCSTVTQYCFAMTSHPRCRQVSS